MLALQYPIILIDEYQDSLRIVIDQFLKWYINKNVGPQFVFLEMRGKLFMIKVRVD